MRAAGVTDTVKDLREVLVGLTPEEIADAVRGMPLDLVEALLAADEEPALKPQSPLEQALVLDPLYRVRPHLEYLSERLSKAMRDVEAGQDRFLVVSMPPRMGKSQLSSVYLPAWILSVHPNWPIGLISHDPSLAVQWGRDVRALVEENSGELGIELARDAGAAASWQTSEKGGVLSRSIRQSITGRGFKVLIVDDAVKDYADAHSPANREWLWNWWVANARTRANGKWLVVFIGTRWHEDDLLGRIQNPEFEGDPAQWEVIKFPAIAEDHDVLGRSPGEPLLSPIEDEDEGQALERWAKIRTSVGVYAWNALYQQRPSPAKGMVFNADWWRFWTVNPANVSRRHEPDCAGGACDCPADGRVVLLDPAVDLANARWTDSWDMAFKATSSSDYVVGQRWAQVGARRYLMHQHRARMTFTQTLKTAEDWADSAGMAVPYNRFVYERLVEDKANGTAVLDTLREHVPGLIAVNPTESKEARARAVTPECEAGNVFFPFPGDPGNEWVPDLTSELREFPSGVHDDQVDAMTQYLNRVRTPQQTTINNPAKMTGAVTVLAARRRGQVALAQQNRKFNFGR